MIAPQPFFEDRGTPISVLGRLKALSDLGYTVDLLTYPIGADVSVPGVTIYRTMGLPFINKVRIGPSLKKALLDVMLLAKAFRMLKRKSYRLLHTHEEAGFFSIVLKRIFHIPHLYDMHSSLPQQLTHFSFFRHPLLVKIFSLLETMVLRSSDAIITICPALSEYVKDLAPALPQVIIENVPTGNNSVSGKDPEECTRLFKAHSGKHIILYTGNLESYQGIDLLIHSAKQVAEKCRDVLFVILGGEPNHIRFYQETVNRLGLSDYFYFTGKRPYNEVPFYINRCDILVSPRIRGTNTPLKIYDYLKSGKPIVATDLYTHTQVLNPDVAELVAPEAIFLAQGILKLLMDNDRSNTLGRQAQKLFHLQYSYPRFVDKTAEAYEMALKQRAT